MSYLIQMGLDCLDMMQFPKFFQPLQGQLHLNNDSEVDILDIVMMVDWILSSHIPTYYQLNAGDLSGDGTIDVLDVVALIELILY